MLRGGERERIMELSEVKYLFGKMTHCGIRINCYGVFMPDYGSGFSPPMAVLASKAVENHIISG